MLRSTPRPYRVATALDTLAVILTACDTITGPEPPDRPAFQTAPIAGVDITTHPVGHGTVQFTPNLWLAGPGQICGSLATYHMDPVLLFRDSGNRYFRISRSDIVVGMEAQLWIEPGTGIEHICPGAIAPTHIVVSFPR